MKHIKLLLAEDNQDEIVLIEEALGESKLKIKLNVVRNGVEAMSYLRKEGKYELADTPDILILDLNMPRKNGSEVLVEIKADFKLKSLPVIILSTSSSREEILHSYENEAHCFITKPFDYFEFKELMQAIENHWLKNAKVLNNYTELFQKL